jgi:DNA-binding PadR family transcriptional regulator
MDGAVLELEEHILLHLLAHRGHQVRFEADRAVTEFGILRAFQARGTEVRRALADLESNRWITRRLQYVVGYSEPKICYNLTPIGHQRAQSVLCKDVAELAT